MSSINALGHSGLMVTPYDTPLYDARETSQGASQGISQNASQNIAAQTSFSPAIQKKLAQQAGQVYGGGGMASDVGKAALNRALKEMQGKVEGVITFDKIYEYQKYLETKFTVDVKVAMTKLGVDPEQEFTITMNAEGAIGVQCDDPATRETVLDFLHQNPAVCEEFGYIQALGNLKRAQQSPVWPSVQASKAAIVANSIELMFDEVLGSGGMDYSALTAQFNGLGESQNVSFYTGLSYAV